MSVLKLHGVRFRYPGEGKFVLDGINLDLEPGRAVMVSGPSGGGKSTLCLVASAVIPAKSNGEFWGKAEIMEENTRKLGPSGASGHVGFVMQQPELSMVMPSVEDEIAFGLENRCWEPSRIAGRVDQLMESLGLLSLSGRDPARLSGGERQMVAIAAAVAPEPALIILDEAFSQLDDERRDLASFEVGLLKKKGSAVLYIEHEGLGRPCPGWMDTKYLLISGKLQEVSS